MIHGHRVREGGSGPGGRAFLRVENDPWGNACALDREGDDVCVRSWGQDGQEGTEDDPRFPDEDR